MKIQILSTLALAAICTAATAQNHLPQAPAPTAPPPYVYEQRSYGRVPVLIDPQAAQGIVDEFHTNYSTLGNPRILIYVNRGLKGDQPGLKLASRSEQVDTTTSSTAASGDTNAPAQSVTTHVVAHNTYEDNGKASPTLADRQTVRDVERLAGRPLRSAGAALVDQSVLAQINGDDPFLSQATLTKSEPARDAVSHYADVVVEVLISSRSVTVPEVGGDKTYLVPDIQMTAIRLKDAKIIGQASAAEIINKAGGAGVVARNFGVQDITEATSLALMEDMLREAK